MSNIVRFWGQSAHEMISLENNTHHSVFINPQENGHIEVYILSSKPVVLKAQIVGEGVSKIVSLNEPNNEQVNLAEFGIEIPDDIEDVGTQYESVVVFKPKGIGRLDIYLDDEKCPSIKWVFNGGSSNIIYDFNMAPLKFENGHWIELQNSDFDFKADFTKIMKRFIKASSEEKEAIKNEIASKFPPKDKDFILFVLDTLTGKGGSH